MSELNALDRVAMRINRANIEARVRRLNNREGLLNLGEQVNRTVDNVFSL